MKRYEKRLFVKLRKTVGSNLTLPKNAIRITWIKAPGVGLARD
jgi:hypothetical protein